VPAPPQPGRATRLGHGLLSALGNLSHEIWGALSILLGLLVGLAVYSAPWGAPALGPVGSLVTRALGDLVGWGRVLIPAGLVVLGTVLATTAHRVSPSQTQGVSESGPVTTTITNSPVTPSASPGNPASPVRLSIGLALSCVALAVLLALAGGHPKLTSPLSALRGAGGLVGAGLADPGRSLIGVPGAAVVAVVAMAVGLALLGGLSFARTVTLAWLAIRGAARAGRTGARWLDGALSGLVERRREAKRLAPPLSAVPTVVEEVATLMEEGAEVVPAQDERAPSDLEGTEAEATRSTISPKVPGPWKLPPMSLLRPGRALSVDRKALAADGGVLERALAAHGVETRLVGMTVGPTVTRFELELGAGVKVARVTSLSKDIAYAMASPDVRILAPIPGRSAIGVEVPNRNRQLVALADILGSEEARRAKHPLEVAMGCDIAGRPVLSNLADMPHILIAGATGAGKSSCLNSLLTSILMRATPEQVRLILVDPKRVELGQYNGLPHLLTQVVVNPKRAANALSWAVHEMERRYDLLAEIGVRDITGYNQVVATMASAPTRDQPPPEALPFICVVVDELNDLMMVAARDVEDSICRIAQMARAVGIHLVIATQRPSVDVITGVIKANIPSRLAFSVSSLADSRVILDQPGAERLVGKGDMLLLTSSSSTPRRIQGPWVSEAEVHAVVAHWRRLSEPCYVAGVEGEDAPIGGGGGGAGDDDALLAQAMDLVVRSGLGSTSMLQRKLRVGFARAGRLMDLLERRGVVGPSEGSKARAVLMTAEELDE
jgi:S-DNA-T family DNA segregation ATPase FtsK/SpoIIIE